MRQVATLFLCLVALGFPALAQSNEPKSAISWLTESLGTTPVAPENGPEVSPSIEAINVEVIDKRSLNGVGILAPEVTGFPEDLWRGTTAPQIARLIASAPHDGVPAVQSLLRQILLARFQAPATPDTPNSILLARVDRLLELGALVQADALLEEAGTSSPDLFRRGFDIRLLTNEAKAGCDRLSANPSLSPARNVQVFCLALSDQWDAAATTLALGEQLEQISTHDADLLSFFLDESLLDELDPPPFTSPISSLEFVIRGAIGLPRPDGAALPIAFMHTELADFAPLRFRIEAAEKLTRLGLIPHHTLFSAYREEKPAASGGVWERASATQQMDAAATGEEISSALIRLDKEMHAVGLRLPAAREFLLYLSELNAEDIPNAARDIATAYLILAGAPEIATPWLNFSHNENLRVAHSIAMGGATGNLEVLKPFQTSTPEIYLSPRGARLNAQERTGETLLLAIELLSADAPVEIDDLIEGLALLIVSGQEKTARSVAVQTLLLASDSVDAN